MKSKFIQSLNHEVDKRRKQFSESRELLEHCAKCFREVVTEYPNTFSFERDSCGTENLYCKQEWKSPCVCQVRISHTNPGNVQLVVYKPEGPSSVTLGSLCSLEYELKKAIVRWVQ